MPAGLRRLNIPRDAGNMCADTNSLYVAYGNDCLQLDAYTGQLVQSYPVPAGTNYGLGLRGVREQPGLWQPPSSAGPSITNSVSPSQNWYDSSTALNEIGKVCSEHLFCFAKTNGALVWTYTNGVIINSTLAIGGGRIYFVDCRNSAVQGLTSDLHYQFGSVGQQLHGGPGCGYRRGALAAADYYHQRAPTP